MNQTDLIKELRALTQAGMKDCKSALVEADWDLQKAVDLVKVKCQNIVSGREGKVAAEGLVKIVPATLTKVLASSNRNINFMIEVNCQTDFVANSPLFKEFVDFSCQLLALSTSFDEPFDSANHQLEEKRQALVSSTKENVVVRRWWVEEAIDPCAKVFNYTHSNNKIGVMLTLLAPTVEAANSQEFNSLGEDLAMQVAAMSPLAISPSHLDAAEVDRQKHIFETQLIETGKPQDVWLKILVGKFNKWHSEVTLLRQESVVVPKSTVEKVIETVGAKLGGEIKVINFIRCQVGEGIEKVESNFAEEVANMTK